MARQRDAAVVRPIVAVIALIGSLLPVSIAQAAVTASVDRDRVEQNESFVLEIVTDTNIDATPDLTGLDADFMIGQASRLSNTRIEYGEIRRSMTWSIPLMARRAGELTIPPIPVGDETSNAVTITVLEPRNEPPGEADVFITAEVDFDSTWVQAQVLYTTRIYRAVATRQGTQREPQFSGAEVLVELAGDERSYESILNGRTYNVLERTFAIFPQESGEVTISPARFEARVLRDGRISGRRVFESEPVTIKVEPIPAPPDEYLGAAWLPAREVEIVEEWSREFDDLTAGEPISRNITVRALGQLETQIPVTEPPETPGINVYPDRPALNRQVVGDGIIGIRTDQYAMIGSQAGEATLPAVELPWFDIDDREWHVARLPEQTLTIRPGADAAAPIEVAEPEAEPEGEAAESSTAMTATSDFWRQIATILAAVWLLTLIAWWWSSRPRRDERAPAPVPIHKLQARQLRAARTAALEGDPAGVRSAMLAWAKLEWPDSPPRSIGALAARVAEPAAGELLKLSRASYGAGDAKIDGEALARAVRAIKARPESGSAESGDPLPPLMPS